MKKILNIVSIFLIAMGSFALGFLTFFGLNEAAIDYTPHFMAGAMIILGTLMILLAGRENGK